MEFPGQTVNVTFSAALDMSGKHQFGRDILACFKNSDASESIPLMEIAKSNRIGMWEAVLLALLLPPEPAQRVIMSTVLYAYGKAEQHFGYAPVPQGDDDGTREALTSLSAILYQTLFIFSELAEDAKQSEAPDLSLAYMAIDAIKNIDSAIGCQQFPGIHQTLAYAARSANTGDVEGLIRNMSTLQAVAEEAERKKEIRHNDIKKYALLAMFGPSFFDECEEDESNIDPAHKLDCAGENATEFGHQHECANLSGLKHTCANSDKYECVDLNEYGNVLGTVLE